jgi:lipid-binding SYLF domain-containing protein
MMIRPKNAFKVAVVALAGLLPVACGGSKEGAKNANDAKVERVPEVAETIDKFKAKDPTIAPLFAKSAGYFIVPTVGEGAFIIGGGHGKGEAFEGGTYIGAVAVSEVSIGAQVGGQSYSELVFFEKEADVRRLKEGSFEFNAEVTAIAADKGAAQSGSFKNGTMAFVLPKKGLMASAAIGGQKVDFTAAK